MPLSAVQVPIYGPNPVPYGMPRGVQAAVPYGPPTMVPYGVPPAGMPPVQGNVPNGVAVPYGPAPGAPYPAAPYPGMAVPVSPPVMFGPLMPEGPLFNRTERSGAPGVLTGRPGAVRDGGEPIMTHPTPRVPAGAGPDSAKKNGDADAEVIPGMPLWSDDPGGHLDEPAPPPFPRNGPRGPCFYTHADYLYYWIRQQKVPTLLSIGPLGDPTSSLFPGGGRFDFDDLQRQGVRLTQGVWLNRSQTVALEASYLLLAQRHPNFSIVSDGSVQLIRPFFNAGTGLPDFIVIAEPGRAGLFEVDTVFRFWTADANIRWELCRGHCYHLDALFGFRYAELDEDINITSSTNIANRTSHDLFSTDNSFWGGQIGLEGELHWGKFYVDLWGKLALGNVHQQNVNQGNTEQVVAGVTNVTPGGLLVQPSNAGSFSNNHFSVLPEVGVQVGYKLGNHVRLSVGYSFLYLNHVARPADQINTNIDPTQSTPNPPFRFTEANFWAHGINAGVEVRY
jgi:hypothetical protein